MTLLLALLWGCAPAGLRSAEARVASLEAEIEGLRAELEVLRAHAPSRRPTRPRGGRCMSLDELGDGSGLLEGTSRRKGKASGGGFVLGKIPRGSLWALARARPGDVVVSVAGVRLERKPDAAEAIAAIRAAGPVPVVVELERDGEPLTLSTDPWCREPPGDAP